MAAGKEGHHGLYPFFCGTLALTYYTVLTGHHLSGAIQRMAPRPSDAIRARSEFGTVPASPPTRLPARRTASGRNGLYIIAAAFLGGFLGVLVVGLIWLVEIKTEMHDAREWGIREFATGLEEMKRELAKQVQTDTEKSSGRTRP